MTSTDPLNPLEVENAPIRGRLKGLSGVALYDRLHPKPSDERETAQDLLAKLRQRARDRRTP